MDDVQLNFANRIPNASQLRQKEEPFWKKQPFIYTAVAVATVGGIWFASTTGFFSPGNVPIPSPKVPTPTPTNTPTSTQTATPTSTSTATSTQETSDLLKPVEDLTKQILRNVVPETSQMSDEQIDDWLNNPKLSPLQINILKDVFHIEDKLDCPPINSTTHCPIPTKICKRPTSDCMDEYITLDCININDYVKDLLKPECHNFVLSKE